MAGVVTLPTLRMGATGPAVNELQRLLVKFGLFEPSWWGKIDVNNFGPVTQQAVVRFQREVMKSLAANGTVDDATWTALYVAAGEGKIVSAPIAQAQAAGSAPALPSIVGTAGAPWQSGLPGQTGAQRPSILPTIILFGGVTALAYYAYKKMQGGGHTDGIAFVDDGEDDAGEAVRAKPRKRVGAARLAAVKLVGTVTTTPKRKHGRKVANLLREEDDDDAEEFESDPGENPSVPIKLEADEGMYKSQKRYREDMRTLAWDRARANNHPVNVVARGTRRVLYSARP